MTNADMSKDYMNSYNLNENLYAPSDFASAARIEFQILNERIEPLACVSMELTSQIT